MTTIKDRLNKEVTAKLRKMTVESMDLMVTTIVRRINYPTTFNQNVNAWICAETKYSFCKRGKQTADEKPNCIDCVLRKEGL